MNDRMPRAMIIDDEPLIRSVLLRLFDCNEWDAAGFAGSEAAIAAFSPGAFDLVLCDIELGEKRDGLEVALDLLARDPSLCVVLMSGDLRHEDRVRAASLRFIGKPFDPLTIYRLCRWAKRTPEQLHEP